MLRLLLTWFLVVAVPLQGFAATSMVVCQAGQHSEAVAIEDHHPAMQDSAMAMPMAHHHVAAATSLAKSADPHGHHKGHAVTKCSVCGACCTSTAVLSGFSVFSPTFAADYFASFVPTPVPAFIAAGLERPPRISFA